MLTLPIFTNNFTVKRGTRQCSSGSFHNKGTEERVIRVSAPSANLHKQLYSRKGDQGECSLRSFANNSVLGRVIKVPDPLAIFADTVQMEGQSK